MHYIFIIILLISCGKPSESGQQELAVATPAPVTINEPMPVDGRQDLLKYKDTFYLIAPTPGLYKDAFKYCYESREQGLSWKVISSLEINLVANFLKKINKNKQFWLEYDESLLQHYKKLLDHRYVMTFGEDSYTSDKNMSIIDPENKNYYMCISTSKKNDVDSFDTPKLKMLSGVTDITYLTDTPFIFEADADLAYASCNLKIHVGKPYEDAVNVKCVIENKNQIKATFSPPLYNGDFTLTVVGISTAGVASKKYIQEFDIWTDVPNISFYKDTELKDMNLNYTDSYIGKPYTFSMSDFGFVKVKSITITIDNETKTVLPSSPATFYLQPGNKKLTYSGTSVAGQTGPTKEFLFTVYTPYMVDKSDYPYVLYHIPSKLSFTRIVATGKTAAQAYSVCKAQIVNNRYHWRVPTADELNAIKLPPDYFSSMGMLPVSAWATKNGNMVKAQISGLSYTIPLFTDETSDIMCAASYNY